MRRPGARCTGSAFNFQKFPMNKKPYTFSLNVTYVTYRNRPFQFPTYSFHINLLLKNHFLVINLMPLGGGGEALGGCLSPVPRYATELISLLKPSLRVESYQHLSICVLGGRRSKRTGETAGRTRAITGTS